MPPRRRRPRVNRHFKIDHALSPDDREAYLAFLREPRNTIDLAHAWLAGKGYRALSHSAVARHRRHYLETYQRRELVADATAHFAHLARDGRFSADALIAGLAARSETLLAEALFDLPGDQKITLEQLDEIGQLVSRMVTTRVQVTELERMTAAAVARGGEGLTRPAPTPALTPEQEREATIKRICEILGEPYPPSGSNSTPPAPAPHPSDN